MKINVKKDIFIVLQYCNHFIVFTLKSTYDFVTAFKKTFHNNIPFFLEKFRK